MPRSSSSSAPKAHFVVDGSNIATEGRSQPSLEQLNDAVLAFLDEHPGSLITVVVDATFGHRIDKKEVKEFDLAVANNELVTPPAGAVGRGDAFVLSIAHKAKAGILSNDSFQEFHGKYDWLFEQGRLIGGKPVPHVGWVFVERSPVRGPKSRQSVKEAKQSDNGEAPAATTAGRRSRRGSGSGTSSGSPLANEPLPLPATPPPGPARAASHASHAAHAEPATVAEAAASAPPARTTVNDLVPFLDFVEKHPVGTSCTAVVESYSSHGAYARSDSVLVYIPLRLMDDPAPRSARSRLKLGEAVTLVVVGYSPERRSVDAALPHMAPSAPAPVADAPPARKPRRGSKAAATAAEAALAEAAPDEPATVVTAEPDESAPASKRSRPRGGRGRAGSGTSAPVADAVDAVDAGATVAEPPAKPARRTRKTAAAAPAAQAPAAPAKRARASKQAVAAEPAASVTATPVAKKPAKRAAKSAKPVKSTQSVKSVKSAGAETAAAPVAHAAPAKRGSSRRKATAPDPAAS